MRYLFIIFMQLIFICDYYCWLAARTFCAAPLELKDARARFSQSETKTFDVVKENECVVCSIAISFDAPLCARPLLHTYVWVCVLVGWLLRLVHSLVVASLLSRFGSCVHGVAFSLSPMYTPTNNWFLFLFFICSSKLIAKF